MYERFIGAGEHGNYEAEKIINDPYPWVRVWHEPVQTRAN